MATPDPETLDTACEEMKNEIVEEYNISVEDAADLFRAIWQRLTLDTWDDNGKAAIGLVEERYSI